MGEIDSGDSDSQSIKECREDCMIEVIDLYNSSKELKEV